MVQLSLLVNLDSCIGCQACEVACKQENNLPVGPRLIRVIQVGPEKVGGKLIMKFHPIRCMHCGRPICMESCPTKAISKRIDGIVLIDSNLCIGCNLCIEVCPFSAPQFNPERGIVEKCTLCVHRVDKGLKPACVQTCPTGALQVGDINEVTESIRVNGKTARCHVSMVNS